MHCAEHTSAVGGAVPIRPTTRHQPEEFGECTEACDVFAVVTRVADLEAIEPPRHVSLNEIAAAIGISESTVRRELRRAEQQVAALARGEPSLLRYLELRGFSRGTP